MSINDCGVAVREEASLEETRVSRPRIVVVGSSNTDMVVRTARIPAPGETVLGGEFVMTGGGKGANQAVAAARLGADVMLVARVGADLFGERARAEIAAAGVCVDYLLVDPDAPSGVALIFVEESGQNSIVVAPGANGRVSPADVDGARPAFESADVVVLQFEVPVETVARAIALGKNLGKTVVLNPAPAPDLPTDFLRGVDVLTPNEHEAAHLLGRDLTAEFDAVEAAQALLILGSRAVVLTRGANGAVVATPDNVAEIPGRLVDAVDATAAGDCFTGALAVGLAEGNDLVNAARFANAAAALSVTRIGAQASLPTREEVSAFLLQSTPHP